MRASPAFLILTVVGVGEAFYHAWSENAFTTDWFTVKFAPNASLFGVPYWVCGVVWFPLILVMGLWSTKLGRAPLPGRMLILLSVGNFFTGYLWYLDLIVIRSFTAAYAGLYVTNYALTGLVAYDNRKMRAMREFTACTVIGMVIGVFFGGFGVAVFGLLGGLFGAIGGYTAEK